jgi:anti-sigma-K factor RskA
MIEESKEAPVVYVPWALAASFGVLCILLLVFGGSLRDKNVRLTERLVEAERTVADLKERQTRLQNRVQHLQTNQTGRINELQRQLVQQSRESEKQKTELQNQLESRANDYAQAQKQIVVLRNRQAADASEIDRLNELVGTSLPNTSRLSQLRVAALNPTPDGPPNATAAAVWDPTDQRGLLVAENLTPLPNNLDYQLWIFDSGLRTPVSGGTFRVNERGTSRIEFGASQRLPTADRFAISIERRGGSTLPQGRIIMATN